jgi:hypothetical protein
LYNEKSTIPAVNQIPELRFFRFLRPFSVEKRIRFLSSLMLLGYIAYKMLFYKQGLGDALVVPISTNK